MICNAVKSHIANANNIHLHYIAKRNIVGFYISTTRIQNIDMHACATSIYYINTKFLQNVSIIIQENFVTSCVYKLIYLIGFDNYACSMQISQSNTWQGITYMYTMETFMGDSSFYPS